RTASGSSPTPGSGPPRAARSSSAVAIGPTRRSGSPARNSRAIPAARCNRSASLISPPGSGDLGPPLPDCPRDAGDDAVGFLFVLEPGGQDDQDVGLFARWKDDGRVVVDAGDVAGLVRHRDARGEAGGDLLVELLRLEDVDHLFRARLGERLAVGD